jgi:hypothetical protein
MLLLPPAAPDLGDVGPRWAASCCTDSRLPDAFCWTKMQAEAGQPLEHIIVRKESERTCGDGLFFWGVGNALGQRVDALVQRVGRPKVAFSVMRSRPKAEDSDPSGILVWTAYVDRNNEEKSLPAHVLLLSRAGTAGGEKTRHYAIVCRSDEPLVLHPRGVIFIQRFRNLGSDTPNVGPSQVTAILEHHGTDADGTCYSVDLRAEMVEPYFVRLARPRLLSPTERKRVEISASRPLCREAWMDLVEATRAGGRPLRSADEPSDLGLSAA